MRFLNLLFILSLALTGCYGRIVVSKGENPISITVSNKENRQHPYFKNNTIDWYTDKDFSESLKSKKKILIEAGRKECGNCRVFVERVVPQLEKELAGYVGVACEIDAPNADIAKIISKYAGEATTLPIIILLDEDGKYLRYIYGSEATSVEKVKKFINGNL